MTRRTTPLTWHHLLLILAVVAVWGTNFVIIKFALAHLPPLLLAALRFALAAFPLVLLVRRPAASWGNLALYGLAIGVGQFALLFYGMQRDITPGLASLVVQAQVFFTVGLAVLIDKERLRPYQWVAALIALTGIVIIASHTDGHTTLAGLLLTLGAAFFWALGNVASRAAGPVDVLAYVAWSSLFAVPPLLLLSWALEGWPRIASGLAQADAATWAAVVWQSLGNTIFGYGVWAWLLARYPAATVAPFSILVPVFGIGASALLMGEALPPWKLLAAGLVMAGLALNLLWPRLVAAARG
ncbi:MAG: EamA family transporter [Burkholderiaceae bacterium]|nr:EamA family transporter [Pseudomonadota bacterium]MBS0597075.1 EamA family transporter [Pseudomonadota bacterium]MCO5114863.1 EamA family transporter [Burkholderiaceae bacterium]MCP5218746.1 EamA family transporter [Burkholderiaceae bacterium]